MPHSFKPPPPEPAPPEPASSELAVPELNRPDFRDFLEKNWGIRFKTLRSEFCIQGSPQRTLARAVIEDKDGTLLLLEKCEKIKVGHRRNVARALAFLDGNGLDRILPPIKTLTREVLPFWGDGGWQLTRFVPGTGLDRPGYLASAPMGANLAGFLIRMHKASAGIEALIPASVFSIKSYIQTLMDRMKIHHPKIHGQYLPFVRFLDHKFMKAHDRIPPAFCHGDFHPLNVIFHHEDILAVIDWEFTGFKPEIFDAANLVGCAGIEDPEGLGMPMVMAFIRGLRQSGIISPEGWDLFPEYVLALRFAWLSEWLRHNDTVMLELEAAFMDILMTRMDELRRIWER